MNAQFELNLIRTKKPRVQSSSAHQRTKVINAKVSILSDGAVPCVKQ